MNVTAMNLSNTGDLFFIVFSKDFKYIFLQYYISRVYAWYFAIYYQMHVDYVHEF